MLLFLFLLCCISSLGQKGLLHNWSIKVIQDYLGWPLCLGETLPPRTSNKKLQGQSAVSTRLPTLQHPIEKQVMPSRELCSTRNFLQTHLKEQEFCLIHNDAFLKRPVLLKYWLLCPFSTRKLQAKAVPRKDFFTHLRSSVKSTSTVSSWILCSDVTSWTRASRTLKNARKGHWVISPD